MLKRLAEAHPSAVQQLTLQYRMHPEICKLASDAIYDGKLVPAVQVPRLQLPNFPKALDAKSFERTCPWLKRVLNPFRPVVFANTDAIVKDPSNERVDVPNGPPANDKMIVPLERTVSREAGGSMVNDAEATLVSLFVHGLVAAGLSPSSIGVICPFRAQVS